MLNVELYGLIDSFNVNAWLVGNLNPSPRFKIQKGCFSCKDLFSYMAIDPIDWPLKYGCLSYNDAPDMPEEVKKQSIEFLSLEGKATPYVVFPDPFGLFEVFYPVVDIINDDQRKHSKDILLGAIEQNMRLLLDQDVCAFLTQVEIPKELTLDVDFQYDQLNRITRQTFDPTKVPKWICPYYKPSSKIPKGEREKET